MIVWNKSELCYVWFCNKFRRGASSAKIYIYWNHEIIYCCANIVRVSLLFICLNNIFSILLPKNCFIWRTCFVPDLKNHCFNISQFKIDLQTAVFVGPFTKQRLALCFLIWWISVYKNLVYVFSILNESLWVGYGDVGSVCPTLSVCIREFSQRQAVCYNG